MTDQTGEALDAIDALRAGVVALARAEISTSTIKSSPQVLDYWRRIGAIVGGKPYNDWQLRHAAGCTPGSRGSEWCGVFALWVLHEAGLTDKPWAQSIGFASRLLTRTDTPEPGDVFVGPMPLAHHGIVVAHSMLELRPWLRSVEGNTPDVRERNRPAPADPIMRAGKIVGWKEHYTYYSILPLIKAKLGIEQ